MEHSKGLHAPTDGRDDRDALVVYASKGKTFLWMLFTFALAVMVVVVWVLGPTDPGSPHGLYDTSDPTLFVLMGILGEVLVDILIIRLLTLIFSTAPQVVVSHEGIWVNSLVFRSIIPWAEIGALLVVGKGLPRVATLYIVLRDRQTLRDRQNRLQGLLWWLNGYALVSPQSIPVPDIVLQMSSAELVGRIQARFQHELVLHDIQVHGA